MNIKIQLISFIVSFLYGFIIFVATKYIMKYFYTGKIIYRFLNSALYYTNIFVIYFIIMYYINNSNIHIYFLLTLLCSYIIFKKIFTKKL